MLVKIRLLWWVLLPFISACVAVNKPVPSHIKASAVNVQLGVGYLNQGNLELAEQKLYKALQQNHDSTAAHSAFAVLQEQLQDYRKAEYHYWQAIRLDPDDAAAANNYGTFLCRRNRQADAEAYFLRALENPQYKTPEIAYTNAGICLLRIGRNAEAREYLQKALAVRTHFPAALFSMARILSAESDYAGARHYLDRFHQITEPTAQSLGLALRVALKMDDHDDVNALSQQLKADFPDSEVNQSWLKGQE